MGYLVGTVVAENVQKYGIILGYKHMVVNDQEAHRESAATFTNEQALREQYLRAFEGAYTKGGAMGCMTAFNRIGCTYCGSSSALLTTVMRGEWAYKGHVTSDAVVIWITRNIILLTLQQDLTTGAGIWQDSELP